MKTPSYIKKRSTANLKATLRSNIESMTEFTGTYMKNGNDGIRQENKMIMDELEKRKKKITMKVIHTTEHFDDSLNACLINLFGHEVSMRQQISRKGVFELTTLLDNYNHRLDFADVFEADNQLANVYIDKECFFAFLITIESPGSQPERVILGLKSSKGRMNLIDPIKELHIELEPHLVFSQYEVKKVQTLVNAKSEKIVIFTKDDILHLYGETLPPLGSTKTHIDYWEEKEGCDFYAFNLAQWDLVLRSYANP